MERGFYRQLARREGLRPERGLGVNTALVEVMEVWGSAAELPREFG